MNFSNGQPIRLIAGRLALDFINTCDWTEAGVSIRESLCSKDDLRLWATEVGLPDAILPEDLAVAVELRQHLRSSFVPTTARSVMLPTFVPVRPIVLEAGRLRKQHLLDIIAASAIAMLADQREMDRVKICMGHDCGWIFWDETQNGRRKWCRMAGCGNRAKAARNYAKRKI